QSSTRPFIASVAALLSHPRLQLLPGLGHLRITVELPLTLLIRAEEQPRLADPDQLAAHLLARVQALSLAFGLLLALLLLFFLAGPEKPLAACLTLTGGGIPLHHLRTHIHSLGVGSLRTLAKVHAALGIGPAIDFLGHAHAAEAGQSQAQHQHPWHAEVSLKGLGFARQGLIPGSADLHIRSGPMAELLQGIQARTGAKGILAARVMLEDELVGLPGIDKQLL